MGEEESEEEAAAAPDEEAMIAFHGAPVSGPVGAVARFYAGRHVLVSFAYPKHLPIVAAACKSFALDCGAYTIWRRGGVLDLEGYIRWVQEWETHPAFAWAIIPDVIDGDEEANQKLISRCTGIRDGVPVWHLHESIRRLRWLCGAYRRVALGSSGEWSRPGTPAWWQRMNEAMAAIVDDGGRPWAKLHGLRMLAPSIISRLPLASADSTNAARNGGDRSRLHSRVEAWQRASWIADSIEAVPCAERWKPVRVRPKVADLFTGIGESP